MCDHSTSYQFELWCIVFRDHTCLAGVKRTHSTLFHLSLPQILSPEYLGWKNKSDFSFAKKKEYLPLSVFNCRNVGSFHAIQDHREVKLNSIRWPKSIIYPLTQDDMQDFNKFIWVKISSESATYCVEGHSVPISICWSGLDTSQICDNVFGILSLA